ncbi:MAG TPA: FtsX-like permease family protein, partial [Gemmatimonadaceae bacterium]
NRYPNGSSADRFLHPVLDAIRGVPGVQSAAAINSPPYVSWGNNDNVRYEGTSPSDQTELPLAEYGKVTPSFFEVTRQRLIAGRLLRPSDDGRPGAPRVVVVNKALADRDFPGQTAVGKRFSRPPDTTMATIVGVVSDVRNAGAIMPTVPEMYWSYDQVFAGFQFPLLVRVTRGDPAAVVSGIRAAVRRVDPTAAVSHVLPMRDAIALSLGQPRFYFSLLGAFAGVALVLAIAGLYGVLGYVVAQRTREMGIRAALGSSPALLIALVMHDGARMVAGGLVLGLTGGYAATRLMTFMLYGVSPLDGPTWAVALLLMTAAGLFAALVPALRTARVDPLLAMHSD